MAYLDFFVDLIFPPRCLHCKKNLGKRLFENATQAAEKETALCVSCTREVHLHHTLFCGKCKARLPDAKKICHFEFPYFLGAAGDYHDEVLKSLIHGLEFQFVKEAAKTLGEFLAEYARSVPLFLVAYSVIPIPFSRRRERTRGFNQSFLVAEYFAKALNLPLWGHHLVREKHTKPQSELMDFEERRKNVAACFAIRNREELFGKKIILLDDVTTSGSTLYEAAFVLKAAGVKNIVALTVAKA